MKNTHCAKCQKNILIKNKNYDKLNNYVICKSCLKKIRYYSKSKLKEKLFLNEIVFKGYKYLLIKNNCKYYTISDIKIIIKNEYESISNFKSILKEKKERKKNKIEKKTNIKEKRKEEITKAFLENKLNFKNNGDSYFYINNGKYTIESIIRKEIIKDNKKNDRRILLAEKLVDKNIILDEKSKLVYNYINHIGDKNLEQVVLLIEIEHFFKTKTNYNELLKMYDDNFAKEIAIQNYYKNKSEDKRIEDTHNNYFNKIILSFD